MKRGSTFVLKGVIFLIGAGVLALCLFLLPTMIMSDKVGYYRPLLVGMYVPAVPFFIALFETLKILNSIDQGKAFSDLSVESLKKIKRSAVAISLMYAVGMPYIFHVADLDDAPGVVLIGFIIVFASIIVAVFSAVLQRLLHDALAIKSENDLTV